MSALLATVVRGMRARGLLTLGSLVLAALAIGSAVLGPVFATASARSYVVTRLSEAPNIFSGLTWEFTPTADLAGGPDGAEAAAVKAVDAHVRGSFDPPTTQLETSRLSVILGQGLILAKAGVCGHVVLVAGRCPTAAGETMALQSDVQQAGLRLGDRVPFAPADEPPTARPEVTLRLVGSYQVDPSSEGYWFDLSRLASQPEKIDEHTRIVTPYRPAPFLVTASTFAQVPRGLWVVRVDDRLAVPPDYTEDDLALARRTASAATRVAAESGPGGELSYVGINDLAGVERDARVQQAAARSAVAPAVISLVLIALALLLRLLTAATELRVPEIALASLRGVPGRGLWLLGLSEPLAVIACAVPAGLLLGPLLALGLIRAWLVPGLPLPLPLAAGLAGLLVVLGAVVVAVLAIGVVLRVPLAGQLSGVRRPSAPSRLVVIAQLGLLAVAVAVLASRLGAGKPSRPDATDLLMPVLLAVLAGLFATRLVARLASWWTRARPRGRSLAGFVAARALSRRQEGTLVILPICAAIAVCVFSAGVYGSAAQWRSSVAATAAPAATVWSGRPSMADTVATTRRLDPAGRYLMAATTVLTSASTYVVVDSSRLARVATWPAQWTPGRSVADVARVIGPRATVPTLTGRSLGLTLASTVPAELGVAVGLVDPSGVRHSVYLDGFGANATSTVIRSTPYCAGGCRVQTLQLGGQGADPAVLAGQVTVERVSTSGGRVVPGVVDGAGWGPSPDAVAASSPLRGVRDQGHGDAATLVIDLDSGGRPEIAQLTSGALPARLPVVAGRVADLTPSGSGLGGVPFDVDPAITAESLPLLGPVGVMVDYTQLTTDSDVPDQRLASYVLADSATPSTVQRALVAAGYAPTTTYAGERRTLGQGAYALALRLYAVVAVLVLLMALAGLVVSTGVQLPARRRDAAALRVVGVRRGTVMSAVALELLAVLGAAALSGIAAGTLAQYVVLRSVTLGDVSGLATPRLVAAVDWGQIGLWAVLAVIVLAVATLASAILAVRGARGASLRETAR